MTIEDVDNRLEFTLKRLIELAINVQQLQADNEALQKRIAGLEGRANE